MLAVKLSGILLLITVCSMLGILKGISIKQRCKKLSLFCDGLDTLYEHIEQGSCELEKAIKISFAKCDFLYHLNGNTFCYDNDLKPQDKTIIDELFLSVGSSAKKAECDRIRLCGITMQKRLKEAEDDREQKCKIYSTFGICIGLGLAVLLI